MKKRIVSVSVLLLVFLLGVFCIVVFFVDSNTDVVATVNGEDITRQQLENRVELNRLLNAVDEAYVRQVYPESQQNTQLEKSRHPVSESEVADDLIRNMAICQHLEQLSQEISFDDAKKRVDAAYQEIKIDGSQEIYYNCLKETLSEFGISEERYLALMYEYGYDLYNTAKMEVVFRDSQYNEQFEKTFDDQFDEYIEQLTKDMSIKRER